MLLSGAVHSNYIRSELWSFHRVRIGSARSLVTYTTSPHHTRHLWSLFQLRIVEKETGLLHQLPSGYYLILLSVFLIFIFILFLQYYYLFKRSLPIWTDDNPFPVAIDFGMKDMFISLRPKLKPFNTFQEAADSIEKLEQELMNKLSKAVSLFLHN